MTLHPAEERLQRTLTGLALLFALATAAYLVAPLLRHTADAFRALPFAATSPVKVALLGLVCLYAAADVRRRHGLVRLLIAVHAVSVAAMVVLLLAADTGTALSLFGSDVRMTTVLWVAIGLDSGLALVILGVYLAARRAGQASGSREGEVYALDADDPLTRAERRLCMLVMILGAMFSTVAVALVLGPLLSATRDAFYHLPWVSNSVVLLALLGLLCLWIVPQPRRRQSLIGIVIAGQVLSVLVMSTYLALGTGGGATLTIGSAEVPVTRVLGVTIAVDAAIALILFIAYQSAWRARYALTFLRPIEFRTLIGLADVLVMGETERLDALQVARNVDAAVREIRAKRRWVYRASLLAIYAHPLLYLKAPFSELESSRRLRHIKVHFYRDVALKLVPDWYRRLIQAAIRVGKQLTYIGYYNDEKTFESVGYEVFSKRPDTPPNLQKHDPNLTVTLPRDLAGTTKISTDICVIGSGAAGAILAYRLAELTRGEPKRILVVERGKYVNPVDFTENEVEMMGKLYADGLFQQTADFRFTILQGSCVGGSTVVNNAVSFDPPPDVVQRWNHPDGFDAGLDLGELTASVEAVRELIEITPQRHDKLNPSWKAYMEGVRRYRADGGSAPADAGNPPLELEADVVDANIKNCLGCGYCNIGCAYGRKLSMLDRVLPNAQHDFDGRVRILAECEVVKLRRRSGNPMRIASAYARLGQDGQYVTIDADTFIVAAGAIASPYLLLRSGMGGELPVGRDASFNMGSPVTAEFEDTSRFQDGKPAYAGLQISHFGKPDPGRGFVMETWWNPPVAQAVNMPGWFEDHFEYMRSYSKMMAMGVLVGTESNARVRKALTGGPDIVYTPTRSDLKKLGDGLAMASELMFEAGAKRVLLHTWGRDVLTHPNQIPDIYRIVSDPSYVTLGTGHPQGGAALSRDPARGVVNEDFRVHGYDNLYLCDASVFPTSVTVNPQLTVMALAHYAAGRVRL